MKAIVIFDTKHGSTAEAAQAVARGLGGVPALGLSQAPADLGDYDLVVFGAPLYFGKWSKAAQAFLASRGGRARRLAFFALGALPGEIEEKLLPSIPPALVGDNPRLAWFGGSLEPARLNPLERLAVRMVTKAGPSPRPLDLGAAETFGSGLAAELAAELADQAGPGPAVLSTRPGVLR